MPEWIAQNIGTVLTVGGSIAVAIIMGVVGPIWAKNHTPRQPIPIQDVWTENRNLRADLISTEDRFDDLEKKYHRVHAAFNAAWAYVERLINAWGAPHVPSLTPTERRRINAVSEDTDTPGAGTPVTH